MLVLQNILSYDRFLRLSLLAILTKTFVEQLGYG